MKKQFLLLAVIIFTGVCFSSLNNNAVKACDANKTACSPKKQNEVNKIPADYTEEDEVLFNMFMNPIIH